MSQTMSENILGSILEQLKEKSYAHFENSRIDIRVMKINVNTPIYLLCGKKYDNDGNWKEFARAFFDVDTLAWFINSL